VESGLDYAGARYYDGGWFKSTDPMWYKYPNITPYAYCANNPVMFVDEDGNALKPSSAFSNSAYGRVYNNLLSNKAYLKIVGKYVNSSVNHINYNFNAGLSTTDAMATTKTDRVIPAHKASEKPINTYLSDQIYYGGHLTSSIGSTLTEIGLARVIIHEGIHSYISAITGNMNQSKDHNTFMKYQNIMFDALKEYSTANNMGFTNDQLTDLSYSGLPENNSQFQNYIQGLADKNGTSYDTEKAAFISRISDMVWERKQTNE
jgi:hypothetical protein